MLNAIDPLAVQMACENRSGPYLVEEYLSDEKLAVTAPENLLVISLRS